MIQLLNMKHQQASSNICNFSSFKLEVCVVICTPRFFERTNTPMYPLTHPGSLKEVPVFKEYIKVNIL